jgi:hypothetical protein
MRLPVFNLVMGAIAGYYFGRKITLKNIPQSEKITVIKKSIAFHRINYDVLLYFNSITGFIREIDR